MHGRNRCPHLSQCTPTPSPLSELISSGYRLGLIWVRRGAAAHFSNADMDASEKGKHNVT